MEEDNQTIRYVLNGDFNAFEKLVEKYQGRIYRHLRKMVKDNSEAQDLLQETFLSAYRGLKGFAGDSTFSTWLFRIASNTALMFLRKNRPEFIQYDEHIGIRNDDKLVPASPEFVSTPLEILLSNEGRKKIEEAIDHLPLIYRTVIILRDVEGFSLEEVAEIIDTSVPAVKSRLHRGRNSVRESLGTYYMERTVNGKRRALQE